MTTSRNKNLLFEKTLSTDFKTEIIQHLDKGELGKAKRKCWNKLAEAPYGEWNKKDRKLLKNTINIEEGFT